MKKLITSLFCLFAPTAAMALPQPNSYKVSVEFREKGDLRLCPGFANWKEERSALTGEVECVFQYTGVVSSKEDLRLDTTGVFGKAGRDGAVDIQYYVGDIDSGLHFKFIIPSQNGAFVFGSEPYKFYLNAGDYAQGSWEVTGTVILSPVE